MELDAKLIDKFDNWTWITSSIEYKKQALQDLEDFCAKEQHNRSRITLEFKKMDNPNQTGDYDPKTNTYTLNESILANDWRQKYRAIDTVIHEGRHACVWLLMILL